MKIKSYKDLIVWQKAFELTKEIYILTGFFPKAELYGLVSQMRRAAVAIISNIAEGFSRRHRKEYAQFIAIAFGSGAELEAQILLSEALNLASKENFEKTNKLLEEVMKMLNVMLQKLNTSP